MERVEDYAYRQGVHGRTANAISAQDHLAVLALSSKYVDSAVSKTCNVGDGVTYDEFKSLYFDAWKAGCKGITTFRASGKRYGILNASASEDVAPEAEDKDNSDFVDEGDFGAACYYDVNTGLRTCE